MGRVLTPSSSAAAVAAASDDGEDLKTSWPELVGWEILNASIKINSDQPDESTLFYSDTTPLPTDYDPKRVIIVFNVGNVVDKIPVVG